MYQPQPTAHGTFEDPTTGLRIDSEPAPPIGSPTRANKLPRGLANPSQMGCAVLNGPSMALLGMSQRAFQEHFGPYVLSLIAYISTLVPLSCCNLDVCNLGFLSRALCIGYNAMMSQ